MNEDKELRITLDGDPRGGSRAAIRVEQRTESAGSVPYPATIRFERGCDNPSHADARPSRIVIEGDSILIEDAASWLGMPTLEAPPHIPVERTLRNIEDLLRQSLGAKG